LDVEEVGFVTKTGKGWLAGCSPDGQVGNDGGLEIKCLKGEHHTKALWEYTKSGKVPYEFEIQVQGQILVFERSWVDLLLYHDKLPKLLIRRKPDFQLIAKLPEQLTAVCIERDDILHALQNHYETGV